MGRVKWVLYIRVTIFIVGVSRSTSYESTHFCRIYHLIHGFIHISHTNHNFKVPPSLISFFTDFSVKCPLLFFLMVCGWIFLFVYLQVNIVMTEVRMGSKGTGRREDITNQTTDVLTFTSELDLHLSFLTFTSELDFKRWLT